MFSAQAEAQTDAHVDILGLWYYETELPVGLQGELTLSRRGERWRAEIVGVVAEGVVNGRNIRIDFPTMALCFAALLPRAGGWSAPIGRGGK